MNITTSGKVRDPIIIGALPLVGRNGLKETVRMADYQETTISGTSYKRANEVFISNPLNGAKTVRFSEELVINISETPQRVPQGVFDVILTDANKSTPINVIDPDSGATISQMTYEQIYGILFSLYLDSANKRDIELARIEEARRDSA